MARDVQELRRCAGDRDVYGSAEEMVVAPLLAIVRKNLPANTDVHAGVEC
jgi:hypothetical protein